ncbi:MAG: type 1 glutamine amidotransferase domain-containing protein [Deltaproteobacteria bacterium]|nr:type 1 glutamine amidotransferase domain-containing protein [Deltaproteobacteria bacterium]
MTKKRILIILIALIVVGVSVRLGLPSVLKHMGLHPAYDGQRYLLPEGKALIITTSHDRLGDGGDETGVFGSELTAPYYEFQDARMSVDVASIKGGQIPIDPMSFKWFIKTESDERYLADPEFQEKVKKSLLIDDIDFTQYDIIYLAGGWGGAYDLGYSKVLGRKISEAYAAGKVVGGVCHGLLGLLLARDENGQLLVKGRCITAVTDKQVEELGISITPQHPERELRAAGAKFESATAFRDMFANRVVVDGRIVSGQNQNAGAEVANLMMKVGGGTRR